MNKIHFYATMLVFLLPTLSASAGVNLPWSTTYDCAEWTHYEDPLICDGLDKGMNLSLDEEITADANYPGGGGGLGQRHWLVTSDGTANEGSGGPILKLNATTPKLWIRWYMRFEEGAWGEDWTHYKTFFMKTDTASSRIMVGYNSKNQIGFVGSEPSLAANAGFGIDFYPSGTSDGTWNYYEVMIDYPNKRVKYWVNGIEKINAIVDSFYANDTGIDSITIGSNIKYKTGTNYIDYDDIAISTTGYIGPYNGPINNSPPDNTDPTVTVAIDTPSQGQTIAGNATTLSASAPDNVNLSGVQFQIDGSNFGSQDTTPPFSVILDTTSLTDGSYSLTAIATDNAGNQATDTVDFTVNNGSESTPTESILFSESFEDTNLTSRGWYDNVSGQLLDDTESAPVNGSSKSAIYHFTQNEVMPDSGAGVRHKFTATDEFYVEYWVKYSSGYQGSGSSSHPHEFFILSDKDADYNSPNYSFLQVKIEQSALKPRVIFRDDKHINISHGTPPIDLTGTTENRAVHGCNGEQDGNLTDCYQSGNWYNSKHFLYESPVISDNAWHKIKVRIKLNTVTASTTNADGIMQYWLDDVLLFDYNDLVMRTSATPDIKFNQFGIGPYIGAGSPVSQTMWLDELKVYTSSPPSSPDGFQFD